MAEPFRDLLLDMARSVQPPAQREVAR